MQRAGDVNQNEDPTSQGTRASQEQGNNSNRLETQQFDQEDNSNTQEVMQVELREVSNTQEVIQVEQEEVSNTQEFEKEDKPALQVQDNAEQMAEQNCKKRQHEDEQPNDEDDVTSSKKLAKIDPYQLIIFYIERKHTTYIKTYLQTKHTVDFTSLGGQRCILEAIKNDDQEQLEVFLKHTPNAKNVVFDRSMTSDDSDLTALMYTIKYCRIGCLIILLKNGVDVNVQNNNGDSALIVAAATASRYSSGVECLRLLIASGSDVNVQNRKGDNALIVAVAV
ncbi:unnamed protein product, partial [Owenia fusiformis]